MRNHLAIYVLCSKLPWLSIILWKLKSDFSGPTDSNKLHVLVMFLFTIKGCCGFTGGSNNSVHTNNQKIHHFITLPFLSIHPPLLTPQFLQRLLFFYSHPVVSQQLAAAAVLASTFKYANANPPEWLIWSLQMNSICFSVSGFRSLQSVGLTCLCSSRSALFPTRIIGNSSLSFTRRICLWNL